jgi:hypothetical protein
MLSRISASSVRPLGAHPVREFLAFQDEGAAIRSSIRSTGPNTNVVMRAREAPKLAQAKRAIEDMRVQRAQSSIGEPTSPSHGENRGSSPLGSANQINCLYRVGQLLLFPSPIFLQINSGTRGTGLLRVLAPNSWRSPKRFELLTPRFVVWSPLSSFCVFILGAHAHKLRPIAKLRLMKDGIATTVIGADRCTVAAAPAR